MTTTVATVYVRGPFPYTVEYVTRLERMVKRYLQRPFHFVTLCDCETMQELRAAAVRGDYTGTMLLVPSMAGIVPNNGVGYWNKVRLFDPANGFEGRVLYIDLDSLIVAPLDPIVDFPSEFAVTEDALALDRSRLTLDRYGRQIVCRFNSSVMVWNADTHQDLWTRWSPAEAQRLSTDQDWIGEQALDAQGLPVAWFPRISQLVKDEAFAATGAPIPPDAKVVLAKKPKNEEACERWPWFETLWGGTAD